MPNPATIVNWATGPCGTTKTNTSPPATSRHDIEGENDDGTFHGAFARRLQGGATGRARRNPRGRWLGRLRQRSREHRRITTRRPRPRGTARSEEHTSELQSLMRISYAVFCLKKKITTHSTTHNETTQH